MTLFEIRRACLADEEAFVQQRIAIFREAHGLEPGPREDDLRIGNRATFVELLPRATILLAFASDRAIGSAAMHEFDRFPSLENPCAREGYVSHVYVDGAWRRRGVGTALVEGLVAEGRMRGLRRIRLHATESGRLLYEHVGFRLRTNDMDIRL
ncbi:MAG: GNAT family N-acetyltransferase [Planctomycetes bacterium]|nr:GNAT family N-acetyltransferase [Planctomycetota bacterium]